MGVKMSIDALGSEKAVPELLFQLSEHLRNIGSTLPTAHALDVAIRAWIDGGGATAGKRVPDPAEHPAKHSAEHPAEHPSEHSRGYQWKELFLPDSTELRMECAGATFYAKVVGDDILYGGRSVSPRGLTLAIAGDGRNAWRDLWLRLPGDRYWKRANHRRRDQERALAAQAQASLAQTPSPPSPADSMAAAAAAMSEALQTSLALVQQCNSKAMPKVDRRGRKHRRESDLLGEDCNFD